MEGLKMVMNWIFTGFLLLSIICSYCTNNLTALSSAVLQGAHAGINLAISMAGALLLWSGVGNVMEKTGLTGCLSKLLAPVLNRIFPGAKGNPRLAAYLSGNICANILGLGNAATPMGIRAVQEMISPDKPDTATNEMCRLVVLNTASIQLIPTTVAAVRSSLGCATAFDILPAVWLTSLLSAGAGILAAMLMGRLWKDD